MVNVYLFHPQFSMEDVHPVNSHTSTFAGVLSHEELKTSKSLCFDTAIVNVTQQIGYDV